MHYAYASRQIFKKRFFLCVKVDNMTILIKYLQAMDRPFFTTWRCNIL